MKEQLLQKSDVSVIIPVWNRAHLLRRCVNSVLAQTQPPREIIVLDDGSQDRPEREIADLPVHFLSLPHCGMPGKLRNRGLKESKSSFVAFLDSDDLWLPEKLEIQLSHYPPNALLSHSRELWMRGSEIKKQKKRNCKNFLIHCLHKCCIGPSTVIMPRLVLENMGGFREDLEVAEDYELWLRVLAQGEVFFLDTALTIKYAGLGDHLSEKYHSIEGFRIQALENLIINHYFQAESQICAALQEIIKKCTIYSNGARKRQEYEKATQYEEKKRYFERMLE